MNWKYTRIASIGTLWLLGILSFATPQDPGRREVPFNLPFVMTHLDIGRILRSWRIKGILVCFVPPKLRACLWVENAYPCGILEVVRQPFASHLLETKVFFEPLRLLPLKWTSSHSSELHFAESRVYTFIPPLPQNTEIPIAAPRGPFFRISYVSEFDALNWRTGLGDLFTRPRLSLAACDVWPNVNDCAGRWGSYDPRIGFVSHSNEVMAAHLQALRAGRAAFNPSGRIVFSNYPFEPRTGHFIQMVAPQPRSTVSIGSPNVGFIEANSLSLRGSYLFVHYGIFEECKRCLGPRLMGPRFPSP